MKSIFSLSFIVILFSGISSLYGQVAATDSGSTPGSLSVSLTGGATYTVPLDLPSGIRDVAPSLAITYNSQGGNGLAGWGWYVSGLSTIARVASTEYHDNEIDPIDFDSSDRFALDGQRLLQKSGTYGKDAATYQTEIYSNIKITSHGTSSYGDNYGPSYFIVYHPDGSRAWYGNTSESKNRLEWAIQHWEDSQGNFIRYNYFKSNDILRISYIEYGAGKGESAPVNVLFNYKDRTRSQSSYIGGQLFDQSYIIDNIQVKNSGDLLRKYQLGHSANSLGYQRIDYIQEYNGSGKILSPIEFTYGSTSDAIEKISDFPRSIVGRSSSTKRAIGDFNGDGRLDVYVYSENGGNADNSREWSPSVYLDLYKGSGGTSMRISQPKIDGLFTGNILVENKLLSKQAITTITESSSTSNSISEVRFRAHLVGPSGLEHQYTRTWNAPRAQRQFRCDTESVYTKINKRYVSGDFNGDGLTDVIALSLPYTETDCALAVDCTMPGHISCCECEDRPSVGSKAYFIDLNTQKTSGYANYSGQLSEGISGNDLTFAADFTGDGKTDLIFIKTGTVYVYSMDKDDNLRYVTKIDHPNLKLDSPILSGDYNGDGKFDLAVPKGAGSGTWQFFLSKGGSFNTYASNIGVVYDEFRVSGDYTYEYFYSPQDFNGDGKTDILKHHVNVGFSPPRNGGGSILLGTFQRIELFANSPSTSHIPSFSKVATNTYTDGDVRSNGLPVFIEGNLRNGIYEYAFFSPGYAQLYEFGKNNKAEMALERVVNNGVTDELLYYPIIAGATGVFSTGSYIGDHDEQYPHVNINNAPGLAVVNEIQQKGSGITRKRDFRYGGAVGHAGGLGFLGFKQVHRSNWYGTGVTRLWNSSRYDPEKRGAVLQEWVSNTLSSSPSGNISQTDLIYNTQLGADGVFTNVPTTVVSKDLLLGTTDTKSYSYDDYLNPISITTTNSAGTKIENYSYDHNVSATDQTYRAGRLKGKAVTSTLNGNSFMTEERYSYYNNLMKYFEKRGTGTPWLGEDFDYDSHGNIQGKVYIAEGLPMRFEYFKYDASGRYLIRQQDVDGQRTEYIVDQKNGNILKATDPYGNETVFLYDGWNRLIQENDYLGKITTYSYTEKAGGHYEVSVDFDQGPDEVRTYNAFGWMISRKTLTLNNKWIGTSYAYDVSGRKTGESEPYFTNASASQWNVQNYDEYNRLIEQIDNTGRVNTISYEGLTTTVSDGTKSISTARDASGNIVQVTDPGGTVDYTYHGNGQMKTADYNGQTVSTSIDGWGRRTKLIDPSAGTYTYAYNGFGEIINETGPKGETVYGYDYRGKVTKKTVLGDETDMTLQYGYDQNAMLQSISGTDGKNGRYYNYTYNYDGYNRLVNILEDNDLANFEKILTYDPYGRAQNETYVSSNKTDGTSQTVTVQNRYDSYSGILEEIVEGGNKASLWKLDAHDSRGNATQVSFGNGFTSRSKYDSYGRPISIIDTRDDGNSSVSALSMRYAFHTKRGLLMERENIGLGWGKESFDYDEQSRLIAIDGPVSRSQNYDARGRITENTLVGAYSYHSDKAYRLASLGLNGKGAAHFNGHATQEITYNAFKKPVEINEENRGRASFEYGALENRAHAWYGGSEENKMERRYRKHYSAIMPVEIIEDTENNTTKIITYVGGDAYTAAIAHIKTTDNDLAGFHYLHRNYLGSILAITGPNGDILEQRQFGAWGTVDKFLDIAGGTVFGHGSILNRGYTGHEHFFEVSLLHMNGRMYDPVMGRFLSPDNYVQEPFGTQNYNRYGYALNNPLAYSDPSGEFLFLAVAIGVAVGAYLGGAQANGTYNPFKWNWNSGSTWTGIGGGAVIGGISAVVGVVSAGAIAPVLTSAGITGAFATTAITSTVSGAAAGGLSGGLMSHLPGGDGDFWGGAARGAITGAVTGAIIGGAVGYLKAPQGYKFRNAPLRSPQVKVSGQARGLAELDNRIVIDADLIQSPKPATPVSQSNPVRAQINDGMGGNLNIRAIKDPYDLIKVQTKARGVTNGFRSFTRSNFRVNLDRLTGVNPSNSHAHHVFPQKFEAAFAGKGINVHNPNYGTWWQSSSHLQNAGAYNTAWQSFLSTNPTNIQIMSFGRDIMKSYGFQVGF